ncbi:MAG: phospho-sugar mutase, partial [Bacteroidota bacterium]
KVYWEDGAQVLPPHDEGIIREVRAVKGIRDVKFGGGNKLIETPGPEVEEEYLKKLDGLIHDRSAILANRELPIVYTSIHGTGITLVPRALKTAGFTLIHVVPEQSVPDGRFPTVTSPNPEEREALAMGLQLCEQVRAELLLGNDPDADRVGIAVRNGQQEMVLLNGNQAGSLLVWYELYQWQKLGRLNGRQYIASTVVTSELFPAIAGYFGVPCYKTLTGFKYIAGVMREREGLETFIAGGEESYGYLAGDFVRDKDAVISSVKFAEIAAWGASQGRSMWDLLMEIYTICGLYHDELVSITMKGIDGLENIRSLMEKLRSSPPDALAGSRIVRIADLKRGTVRDARTGEEKPLGLPLSNVLQFELEDGSRISARPSGTEPKIKFYFSFRDEFLGLQHYATQISVMHDRVTRARKELGVEAG